MLRFVKISIVFMTIGIVVLTSLILNKLFTSSSSSATPTKSYEIALNNADVKSLTLNKDEIAVLTEKNEIFIFNRSNGSLKEKYTSK